MPLPALPPYFKRVLPILTPVLVVVIIIGIFLLLYLQSQKSTIQKSLTSSEIKLSQTSKELTALKNQDQVKRNNELQATIKSIESSYKNVIKTYEIVQDLKAQKQKTDIYDKSLTQSLSYLANRNYASAEATLTTLNKQIAADQAKAQATVVASAPVANATSSNTPPGSGFAVQKVSTDIGEYTVALVAADMGSTKIIVDTASDSDCRDNCPVLSLGDYVSRNGAFAGVNGSYFCPAEYPSCAGKTGSFDLLAMNKNKNYLNSDNNVYSTNPAVIFQSGSMRFVGQASQWGRDTGVDGVLSNYPLLVSGGNIAFSGDGDPKKGSKGSRSFVGNKGNTAYIGVIYNVTVAEGAHVLKSLGLENALNLDSGGSTALWSGGYKVGPGRNIPNAILIVRK
jgi:hypothetical protein